MSISIKEVVTRRQLRSFITFPEKLYKNHPLWVPALISDEFNTLLPKKNAAFKFCEAAYFLAYRDKEIVGRVAAIINHNANKDWNEKIVRFGWIDFIEDYSVVCALLDKVIEWGTERGMTKIKGPLGFSDMDKEGLLVEGFENMPSITCIYNFPYYGKLLEQYGFKKDVDWTQKIIDIPSELPEMFKYEDLVKKRFGLSVMKPKNNKELAKKGIEVFTVLNNSFSKLYEFTKLSDEQIRQYVKQYIPFVNVDLVCVVLDKDENVVGFSITVPSLSVAMRKAKGRLFPFGFLHILRAMKKNNILEAYMIGVVPEYQGKGVNVLIFSHLHHSALKYGITKMITNPQLEDNYKVQTLFGEYEAKPYMRRRSYKMEI